MAKINDLNTKLVALKSLSEVAALVIQEEKAKNQTLTAENADLKTQLANHPNSDEKIQEQIDLLDESETILENAVGTQNPPA